MGLFDFLKKQKNKKSQAEIEALLNSGLTLSKAGKLKEAYPFYLELYQYEKTPINAFNLLQASVYTDNREIETETFDILKDYIPDTKFEPMELHGAFVKLYYGLVLCDNKRNDEAIPLLDYLLEKLSEFQLTDSKFLYANGMPHVGMVKDLLQRTFKNDPVNLAIYKKKLLNVVDVESKQALIEHYKFEE